MILRPFGLVCLCAALLIGASIGIPGRAQAGERRLGLVIGEASYAAGALATPANDAGLIAHALASDDFEVTGYADLDLPGTRRALSDFLGKVREAGPDAVAVVYLAGYGVQFGGDDFLAPVDARIARDVDVPTEAVRLSDFSRDLAALPLKARVLVYDLARPHPFAKSGTPLASGLAMVGPQTGSLVAFNTGPGLVASLEQGDYGLYAQALAEMLQTKGLGLDTVFSRLRARVDALSNGAAVPWTEGSLETPFVLLPPATDAPSLLSPFRALLPGAPADGYWTAIQRDTLAAYGDFSKAYPRDPLAARIATLLAARREATTWAQSRRANLAAAYWTYMRRYPRGPHFADARRGLAALPAALEPPPRFDLYAYTDLPPPRPDEIASINRPFVTLDADEDAPVPAPPATVVPDRPTVFYDLLPPLLAVGKGTLPLPAPRGSVAGSGQIIQTNLSGPEGAVVATDGTDKSGDPAVRQAGPDGHVFSVAIRSAASNGGIVVTQTGPDNVPAMKTVLTVGPNGGRTVTQTGPDGQVIATMTTVVAAAGNRVTTTSGPDGLPRAVVTTTAAGMMLKPRGGALRLAAPAVVVRPVVLRGVAKTSVTAPLLATEQGKQGLAPPAIAAVPTSAAPAFNTAPQATPTAAPQPPAPPMVTPKDVVAPASPMLPTIAPASVPEPAVPAMAPIAMPTIAMPSVAAPPPASLAPSPAIPPAAPAQREQPMPPSAPAESKPAAIAEPVPPRKTPEPAAAVAPRPPEPLPAREKPALAPAAQPTPPQRPKAVPAKAAPTQGVKPSKASKPVRNSKPAAKKPAPARRAAGKHRG